MSTLFRTGHCYLKGGHGLLFYGQLFIKLGNYTDWYYGAFAANDRPKKTVFPGRWKYGYRAIWLSFTLSNTSNLAVCQKFGKRHFYFSTLAIRLIDNRKVLRQTASIKSLQKKTKFNETLMVKRRSKTGYNN